MDLKHSSLPQVGTESESVGHMVGKVTIAWTGLFAGITLSDVVLLATLIYTLLNIAVLLRDKFVRPWLESRRASADSIRLIDIPKEN